MVAQSLSVACGGFTHPFGRTAASALIAAALAFTFEAVAATPLNPSSAIHRERGEALSNLRRESLPAAAFHLESRGLEQGNGSCAYKCEQPCDASCRSAFAVCNQGGTLEPICSPTNESQAIGTTAAGGWVNPINCTGGSLLCDVVLASPYHSLCSASSDAGAPLGSVILDTDSSSVQFAVTDLTFRLASVDLYLGSSPDLSGNDSFAMHSWYYPYVQQAIMPLSVSWSIGPGTFFMAHASVCPGTSTPTASPSSPGSPVLQPTLPRCTASPTAPSSSFQPTSSDVVSTSSAGYASSAPSIVTRRRHRRRRRLQSLEVRDATCPNQCQPGQVQACDSTCQSAWAYCNTSTALPTCVFHNRTQSSKSSMSWTNPISCLGSYECDLYLMPDVDNRDCAIDEAAGDVSIGTVRIDTDAETCSIDVRKSAFSMSSVRVRGFVNTGASADYDGLFAPNGTQAVWFDGTTTCASLPLAIKNLGPGALSFAAHVHVCPVRAAESWSSTVPTVSPSSDEANGSTSYPACPLFPRFSPPPYISLPSYGETSAPSQVPYTLSQLLASAVAEGIAIDVPGLLGLSPQAGGSASPNMAPTTSSPNMAPATPGTGVPPQARPPYSTAQPATPRSGPQPTRSPNLSPESQPEPNPSPEMQPEAPTRSPGTQPDSAQPSPFATLKPTPPRTNVPTEPPTPFTNNVPTITPRPSVSPRPSDLLRPSSAPSSSPKLSLSSEPTKLYPLVSPTIMSPSVPPTSLSPSLDTSTSPESSNAPYEAKAIADATGSARSSAPTQFPQSLFPPSFTPMRDTLLPSTTPVSRSGAQGRSAAPIHGVTVSTAAPSVKPTHLNTDTPTQSLTTRPMETGNPVASPTHEPTATTVAEPSHSPQAPPREEPVKTNRPSTDTVEAGKGTSHTRRVKEARDERDSDATCSVAHVHCGSACRCGQFSEKTAQIEQGKHEPSGESQTLLWNDIGGFGNLKCNLLLVASELDCGKILQESVIGEVEVNSGSGELSASFFWERRLQGNGSTSLALPIVYFTHLNVLDDTLRQPIVAKPVVKWADVTFGIHEAHATGRFSINVAVNEGFHAYISFCVT